MSNDNINFNAKNFKKLSSFYLLFFIFLIIYNEFYPILLTVVDYALYI